VVVHSGPELVPQFDKNLQPKALHSLKKEGAKVILNTQVMEVGDGFAKLSTKMIDKEIGDVTG
jgi:NADH dehydrogenase FAD-containing subunit